jgi:hypothetical protein
MARQNRLTRSTCGREGEDEKKVATSPYWGDEIPVTITITLFVLSPAIIDKINSAKYIRNRSRVFFVGGSVKNAISVSIGSM